MNSFHNKSLTDEASVASAKKLMKQLAQVQHELDQRELVLHSCQQVALAEEEGDLQEAFDYSGKALDARQEVKRLEEQRRKILRVLGERRKSLDAV